MLTSMPLMVKMIHTSRILSLKHHRRIHAWKLGGDGSSLTLYSTNSIIIPTNIYFVEIVRCMFDVKAGEKLAFN
jgi:hypothetical protein